MKTKIFYFTGTGNSLSVARDISNELGGAELVSIPAVVDGHIETDDSDIGIVFPVYMWGIPNMVVDFVQKLKISSDQYVFAVTTCAGQPGETLVQLQKMLQKKGTDLHAGFAVRETANTIQEDNIFIKIAMLIERNSKITKSGKERLSEMVEVITNKKEHEPETSSVMLNKFGNFVYGMGMSRINTMGKFWADEKCSMCLNCQRICPSNNIEVVNDKPHWTQNCEFCQACIQWCPKEAIHIKNEDPKRRYHNPEIKVKDIMIR
ncbi:MULTISPECIES: EFR1 family ferrodoxin [Methanobacterium]|jgi:ferredoxin|uniref:EFR1 family ferrodoxin n=1 Tax=Methanobacterium veterum TaxID=408577 RepID=A0A9E5DNQ8_9EURY|nr:MULTISPECIES: EFR1 family ferrodoxin [Methanobacterium]MCZ3366739.1 EFR1 family ferrodoxin [Methanobacterium veterum]MCZ3374115.1 EFR1 family ferrodoxin [Methanobacterium veterum]